MISISKWFFQVQKTVQLHFWALYDPVLGFVMIGNVPMPDSLTGAGKI